MVSMETNVVALDDTAVYLYILCQHGLALRSSMRSEPLLQTLNHKAAFSVVDCYPHGERGFFFGQPETKKAHQLRRLTGFVFQGHPC